MLKLLGPYHQGSVTLVQSPEMKRTFHEQRSLRVSWTFIVKLSKLWAMMCDLFHHTPAMWPVVVILKNRDPLIWYLEMKCNEDMMSERASFRMFIAMQ
jgi:hypothetical protein